MNSDKSPYVSSEREFSGGYNVIIRPFRPTKESEAAAQNSVATILISTTNPVETVVGCTAIGGAIAYGSVFIPLENTDAHGLR
jgi:hypothetical protein